MAFMSWRPLFIIIVGRYGKVSFMQALELLPHFSAMKKQPKSSTGQQSDIKEEMARLYKKARTEEQIHFTNLEELQDLARSILPKMVSIFSLKSSCRQLYSNSAERVLLTQYGKTK